MRKRVAFLFLITLSVIATGCKQHDIEPGDDITGQYDVYKDGVASTVFKSVTTNESTLLEVKKGVGDDQYVISYGLSNLYISVSGSTFTITPQGVWAREVDGVSHLGSIKGNGKFYKDELIYQYMAEYNHKSYEENGLRIVRAKRR